MLVLRGLRNAPIMASPAQPDLLLPGAARTAEDLPAVAAVVPAVEEMEGRAAPGALRPHVVGDPPVRELRGEGLDVSLERFDHAGGLVKKDGELSLLARRRRAR